MSSERFPYDLSYHGALEAGGATVLAFQEFGSYQGEWLALVEYKGERGWVSGYYGSCSGCDAIQGDFDYGFGEDETYGWYEEGGPRRKTDEEMAEERARFEDFGRSYLEDALIPDEKMLAKASENLEWDMDASEMVAFVRSHAAAPLQPAEKPEHE